jgi:ubiquinone biosynthesis protein UbiJ
MNAATLWIRPFLEERVTLIANHLLASEAVATNRMQRHAGRLVAVKLDVRLPFRGADQDAPTLRWQVTPAGLLELLDGHASGGEGLTVAVDLLEPLDVFKRVLSGQRPSMGIQGDADFAADVAWLIDNLRWDVEDDLARVVGGPQAHLVVKWLRGIKAALQGLAGLARTGVSGGQGAGTR